MKITEEYLNNEVEITEIKDAQYIGDYAIRIFFNDGFNKRVDFKPFLKSALHPSIRKYMDEEKFKEYKIIDGNLNWNDYDMIFPIEDLYKGKL